MKETGLSLLETLSLLLLLTLISAISISDSKGLIQERTIKATLTQFTRDVKRLQHLSTSISNATQILLTPSGYRAIITKNERELFSKKIKMAQFILTSPDDSIHFYPSGVVSPKSIRLKFSSKSCTISISLRSRVRYICED